MQDDNDELIDVEEVCREIGGSKPVDKSTIYRAIQRGDFDPPFPSNARNQPLVQKQDQSPRTHQERGWRGLSGAHKRDAARW